MTLPENGKTLVGGINQFRLSEDERALIWTNDAGERISRPADAVHVYLWRKLQNMTQEAEAAFEQVAQFVRSEQLKKNDGKAG